MTEVHVFATIRPRPGHRETVRAVLAEILTATRAEAGCRRFELLTGTDDGNLYLVEAWDSDAALTAHHQMNYTRAAAERLADQLEAETEVIRMELVDVGR